jgi:peptidoglycan/xylan/chitin deacetylase (PgdA/CDA1 family)
MPAKDCSCETLIGESWPGAAWNRTAVLRRIAWAGMAGWPLATAGLWRWSPAVALSYALSVHVLAFYGMMRANCGLYGPVVRRFATTEKEVWLTIDDGPFAEDTGAMLALLERHRARATFFLEGQRVAAAPSLVRSMAEAGHTIGNHSQNHRVAWFWAVGPGKARREISECNAALNAIGVRPVGFRAPVGMANFFVHRAVRQAGLPLIGWSARGFDGLDGPAEKVMARLRPQIRPGAIILLHQRQGRSDGKPRNAAILSMLLEALHERGYRCVLPERSRFLGA